MTRAEEDVWRAIRYLGPEESYRRLLGAGPVYPQATAPEPAADPDDPARGSTLTHVRTSVADRDRPEPAPAPVPPAGPRGRGKKK